MRIFSNRIWSWVVMIGLSISFLLMNISFAIYSATEVLLIRLTMATILLVIKVLIFDKSINDFSVSRFLYSLLSGGCIYLAYSGEIRAFQDGMPSSIASAFTGPLASIVTILITSVFRKKISVRNCICVTMLTISAFVLVGHDAEFSANTLQAAIGAMLGFGISQHTSNRSELWLTFLTSTGLGIFMSGSEFQIQKVSNPENWMATLAAIVLALLLLATIYVQGKQEDWSQSIERHSMIIALNPGGAAIVGWFFLGERLTSSQIIAMTFVLVASLLVKNEQK